MNALKYLDVIAVLLALILGLILGAPAVGLLVGCAAWLIQRVVQYADRRYTATLRAPRKQLGIHLFESFGRIWLLAIAIIVAGVAGGRKDGLTAAIVIVGAYTIAFAIRLSSGKPPERELS
ncbi:MAG TPA: hypothetical protein VME01_08910 [Solirubrobacteraceae bacterium]|nr:hypothetical protein [Solirubrobacteraceae bacterium]